VKIGIDASNISSGGGVSHLVQLLAAADRVRDGFSEIVLWTGSKTAVQIKPQPWLKIFVPFDRGRPLPFRLYWQQLKLPAELRNARCDVLFAPGGTLPTALLQSGAHRIATVTASRNLLPFMNEQSRRYRGRLMGLKLQLLRQTQARSFKRASGVIFLTEFARSVTLQSVGEIAGIAKTIPHGVDLRFRRKPGEQKPIHLYSPCKPFNLLYVSTVDFYKHQCEVAEAVARLRQEGVPVQISFVGGAYPPALARLRRTLRKLDPTDSFLHYYGPGEFTDIHSVYHAADAFVFASTCENLPNIVLEAMASGLPIICSNRRPMNDILGDAGIYMNPLETSDIQRALKRALMTPDLRARSAQLSFERAQTYTWQKCAQSTFAFIQSVVQSQKGSTAPLHAEILKELGQTDAERRKPTGSRL
jgi:glycosyltransferase involved in cell wall biosynthesis